jgi:hypothetical protein
MSAIGPESFAKARRGQIEKQFWKSVLFRRRKELSGGGQDSKHNTIPYPWRHR